MKGIIKILLGPQRNDEIYVIDFVISLVRS